MSKRKILVLGASGMLGHMLFKVLSDHDDLDVFGTIRGFEKNSRIESLGKSGKLLKGVHFESDAPFLDALKTCRPDVIVNCIGLIRQKPDGQNHLACIELNSKLPHKLFKISQVAGARFIHVSTDCVFNGNLGNYTEESPPSAEDVYGLSKFLGEVHYEGALTLRTSIIGPELSGKLSLLEWFLSQSGTINGFDKAIYSGLPTYELSQIIKNIITKFENLSGLYQVSTNPISKYELLKLIADTYSKQIEIKRLSDYVSDKSLSFTKFAAATEYIPKNWEHLINDMYLNDTNRGLR